MLITSYTNSEYNIVVSTYMEANIFKILDFVAYSWNPKNLYITNNTEFTVVHLQDTCTVVVKNSDSRFHGYLKVKFVVHL